MHFSHIYFMENSPERVRDAVPRHIAYWKGLALDGYLGGPFADRSGGLIAFEAASVEEAEAIVANDPFMREGLLAEHWVKEWVIE